MLGKSRFSLKFVFLTRNDDLRKVAGNWTWPEPGHIPYILSIKKFMLLHSELFLFNFFYSVKASTAENLKKKCVEKRNHMAVKASSTSYSWTGRDLTV